MNDERIPQEIIDIAIKVANKSPCEKSKRGAVVFHEGPKLNILGAGFNGPPNSISCTGSESCKLHCSKRCVHAESRAIRQAQWAMGERFKVSGPYAPDLLHIKTIDGRPVPSGPPSCWQCSREILDSLIVGVWLLHEEGWKYYTSKEFHDKTLEHCGIE